MSSGTPDLPPGGNSNRGNPWDSIGNRRGDGSAIHDLEDMTGQKIDTFHSSGSGGYSGGSSSGGSFSGLSLAQERAYQQRYQAQLLQLEKNRLQNEFNRQMANQFAQLGAQLLTDALFGDHGEAQLAEQRRLDAIRRAEEERRRREEEERQRRERVALAARQRREADEREE